jgi:hypothetical protein
MFGIEFRYGTVPTEAKRGSNQLPISAPAMPMAISATSPKPVPFTTCPASHPAISPTTKMMSKVEADMIVPPSLLRAQTKLNQR